MITSRRFVLLFTCSIIAFSALQRNVRAQWLTKADESPSAQREHLRKSESGEREGIGDALKWYWGQRTFGLGYIPKNALQIAEQKVSVMRANSGKGAWVQAAQPTWKLIGPNNSGGRVEAVAIDPTDQKTIYIGAANGGVWKTTDAGTDWTPLTDNLQSLAMGSLAIDPENPKTIFAGTGEFPSTTDSYTGYGLLRSTDAGVTWSDVGPNSVGAYSRVIVNPKHSNLVYAAAGRAGGGVLRSSDGGTSWQWLAGGLPKNVSVSDLALSMNGDVAVLYAGLVGNGVWRSTDGGTNWTKLDQLPFSAMIRLSIAVDPTNWQNVVVLSISSSFTLEGISSSSNGGASWNDISSGLNSGGADIFNTTGNPQGWYDMYVRADPSDFNHLLVGAISIWETRDGGQSWNDVGHSYQGGIHPDQHDAAFAPSNPSQVYIGCDGGVIGSSDGGDNFNSGPFTIPISEFYTIGADQTQADMTYGGLQDNGLVSGASTGDWGIFDPDAGDGAYAVPDPNRAGLVYCTATQSMPQRADNGNITSMGVNPGSDYVAWLNPLHLDAKNNILYFGLDHLFSNSNPATSNSWKYSTTKLALPSDTGTSIQAIDAFGDKQTVLCGTSGGHVFLTANGGTSWTNVSGNLPGRWVTCVKFNPSSKTTFYATVSGFGAGHVFKTINNGAVWQDISSTLPDIPVSSLVMDPQNPAALYIGTDVGVFFSPNDGGLWLPYGTGLPNVAVDFMDIQINDRVLRAGTHGRSVWQIPLVDDMTGISMPAQRTVWTIGDSASIAWHDFGAQVTLDLSFDGGTTWQNVASGVTASSYGLSNVVYPPSENALVRVSDGTDTLVSPLFSIVQQKLGDQLTTVGELPLYLYDLAYDKDDNVLWATTYDQSGNLYKIDPDKGTLLGSVKVAVNSKSSMAGLTGIKYDPKTKHLFLQQVLNTSDPYAWQSFIYEVTTDGTIVNSWPSPAEYGTGIFITGDTILVADRMTQQVKMATFQDMNFNDFNPLLDFSATRGAVYGARGITYDPKLHQYLLAYTDFEGTRQNATFNGSDLLFLDPNQGGIEVNSVPVADGESTANIRGLEYDPRGNGNTAWITILNTFNSSKIVKIALADGPTGAAGGGPAVIAIPYPIDFGSVDTGTSKTLSVQLYNTSSAPDSIASITINQEPNGPYSLGSPETNIILKTSMSVPLTFAPHTLGTFDNDVLAVTFTNNNVTFLKINGIATFSGAGVSLGSQSDGWSLEISPNPARDYVDLTVTTANADEAEIRIFDVTGREVRTMPLGMLSIGEDEKELSTEGLPNGIYFVRITGTNGEVCAARLAIER